MEAQKTFQYQNDIILSPARLILWLKARQIGGSTTAAIKSSTHALETGEDWSIMSRTARQAGRFLEKCAAHIKALSRLKQARYGGDPLYKEPITSERIRLTNGGNIFAVPCDADTTAGESINWVLDEFPLFPDSHRVFGIIKPSIRWGRRFLVLGTARGRKHKFYELWERWLIEGPKCGWLGIKTTLADAVRLGCPLKDHEGKTISYEEFKEQEVADIGHDFWRQEYECEFVEDAQIFLHRQLIIRCMDDQLQMVRTPAAAAAAGPLYIGVDVGRRHDLTVIWVLSQNGIMKTESVHELDQVPFAEQERQISEYIATGKVVKCCIDEQGIGMQLAENLQAKWPGIVEPIKFTNPTKDMLSSRLKTYMEGDRWVMPRSEALVDDFNSIEKVFSDYGNPVISAPRRAGGHADRFWAAALALHGAALYEPFGLVLASAGTLQKDRL